MIQPGVYTTHDVTNQPGVLENYDAYSTDSALRCAVTAQQACNTAVPLQAYGKVVASAELLAWAVQANRHCPELRTHDRFGHRIDQVEYHPAYHEIMRRAMQHQVHSIAWKDSAGQVAHAALSYLHAQAESGTACPLTMTHACVPTLRLQPDVAAQWLPKVLGSAYDERYMPVDDKRSATVGMAMTEKQGGSDVRANSTRAVPLSKPGAGQDYVLTGHKWFCSAPMSDAFLTLAQTDAGLSCFLVPRWWRDGTRNRFFIQRLKDKLGNRSNASSEIEYERTLATMIGEPGRGVASIMPMVALTRLDCAAGSAGLMRQALVQAVFHASRREAFGRKLIAQPLMRNVLADLALEAESAIMLTLRVARSLDPAADAAERLFARVATAVAKFWVTRRTPRFIFEAMECLGGAGYVEESVLPRLYRESPLNSIWEGSGNVQCLDVLRAVNREPGVLDALMVLVEANRGKDAQLDAGVHRIKTSLADAGVAEAGARRWVEDLALVLSAGELIEHAPPVVAQAYCRSRLGTDRSLEYGCLPADVPLDAVLERVFPTSGWV
jgi:putative acyl-CoA dehydrogenase